MPGPAAVAQIPRERHAFTPWPSASSTARAGSRRETRTSCVEALKGALRQGRPEVFNTDQGSQFTSEEFTDCLESSGGRISMDGRGRRFDNIFIERLWRTVEYEEACLKDYEEACLKDYEEACLKDYEDGRSAARSLGTCFGFYNREQLHEALGYRVPEETRFEKSARRAPEFSCAARSLAVG